MSMLKTSRPFAVERKTDRKFAKPRVPNHQDALKAHIGKRIGIVDLDGEATSGILVAADQFTLDVTYELGCEMQTFTIFKHSLHAYRLIHA